MLIPARLAFDAAGTPFSEEFADVYHSADGGPEQARHVFLGGNDLPARWQGRESFVIVETGFGLGLNFLATWAEWLADPRRSQRLHFVSVEKHPFATADLAQLHAHWPALAPLSRQLVAAWPPLTAGFHRLTFGGVTLTLLLGDIAELLPKLRAVADAFYLDGFAPEKNAQMWSPAVLRQLARLARPGATLATWSVAGGVRQGLADAGFLVTRRPGFGRKREMLVASLPASQTCRTYLARETPERCALVVGAGMAGSSAAERLAARGWQVDVIERNPAPAMEASGNHAGVLLPLLARDDNIAARLSRACYLYALRHLQAIANAEGGLRWNACGVLQLARDAGHQALQRATIEELGLPADFARLVSCDEAARLAGRAVAAAGCWFPGGGWVAPPSLCRAQLGAHGDAIRRHFSKSVATLRRAEGLWHALAPSGEVIARAPVAILANARDALALPEASALPLRRVRGQVSHVPATAMAGLRCVVCREGYVAPGPDGLCALGASFDFDDDDPLPRLDGHVGNLTRLERLLPGSAGGIDPATLAGRVGFRTASPDRLPLIGALPAGVAALSWRAPKLSEMPRHSGLYGLLGYGARGLVWAPLAAELLASQLEGEPLPLPGDLVDAVDPARFALRAHRRRAGATAVS
jgi:tRNA 5-methylaminomethyl-2-thiouridine biosynthesis bifunctional protein